MEHAPSSETDGDSRRALCLILEAWDEGTDSGIRPEMMAYAALFAALTDLVESFGEDAVVRLTDGLAARIRKGEFTLGRQCH